MIYIAFFLLLLWIALWTCAVVAAFIVFGAFKVFAAAGLFFLVLIIFIIFIRLDQGPS